MCYLLKNEDKNNPTICQQENLESRAQRHVRINKNKQTNKYFYVQIQKKI